MSKGEYAAFYGSIGYQLSHIAVGQRKHDYAVIPESVYADWKKLLSFDDEKMEVIDGEDNAKREKFIAHFTDSEHSWIVSTIKCPHPDQPQGINWRLILNIERDGEELSHSKMSADEFWRYIKSRG